MFIKQLKLEGFRGFEKLTLDFPFSGEDGEQKPVPVVLLGLNGAGKSSVLDAITMNIEELFHRFGNIRVGYREKPIFAKDFNIKSNLDYYHIESVVQIENELISFISDSKKRENNKSSTAKYKALNLSSKSLFSYYPTNRYANVNFKNDSLMSKAYYSFARQIIDFTPFLSWYEKNENLENQEKIYKNNFGFSLKSLDVVRNGLEVFLNEFGQPNYDKIRILRESVNTDRSLFEETEEIYKTFIVINIAIDKNGQTLKFSQLSHGEQMIILVVSDIARRLTIANPKMENPLEGKGMVLIDEIELHLHPTWQGKVVNALSATFPNIQFIVTTHSPLVINHVKRESLFMLENFQLQQLNGFNNYGADIEEILYMVQKVEDEKIYPKDLVNMFKQYFEEIENGELDKAKETKRVLETMTDFQHPEIMKGDSMIKLKELMG